MDSHMDSRLTLDAPPPVAPVPADKAAGLVPLDDQQAAAIDARVADFVRDLVAQDVNSPAFGARVDQLAMLGQQQIDEAARPSNRFLDQPVRAMDGESGIGADLSELRRTVEDLDPATRGNLLAPRRLFGLIPFGSKARRYFDSYKSAQTHIATILSRLQGGKDELLRDNAAIDVERRQQWQAMGQLEQMIHMAKQLDQQLETAAASLDAHDPAKAKVVRETALFATRQRTTDLLTQMAVSVQGYLALDLVKKNNLELMKGVDRASTTTVAALRTAVTVAQALTSQKLVLDQISALNSTTASVIEQTGKMLAGQTADIHRQAASATVPVETLKQAFQTIYQTMDSIDTFKVQALQAMKETVDSLSSEIEKSRAYVARAEGTARLAGTDSGANLLLQPVDG